MGIVNRLKSRRAGKQKHLDAVGREFAHAIDLRYSSLSRRSYKESLSILRRIEAEYVARLSQRQEFVCELNRRTAELMLEQALIHGCSLRECRKKLVLAEGRGWTLIDRKLHFRLLYARGMVARCHYRAAKVTANNCIDDIQHEIEKIELLPIRRGRKYFMDWFALFTEVLNQVRESDMPNFSCRWDAGGRFIRNRA